MFLFPEKVFFIIKSERMIHFSPLLIGVFVLVCPLFFYYSIILMTSLAFFPRKHCTLPTTLEIGKIHNRLHFPKYQFTENILEKTLEVAFPRP